MIRKSCLFGAVLLAFGLGLLLGLLFPLVWLGALLGLGGVAAGALLLKKG